MAFDHDKFGKVLGVSLRAARVFEAEHEEAMNGDGMTTFLRDLLNAALSDTVLTEDAALQAAKDALDFLDQQLLGAHSAWLDRLEDWLPTFLKTLTSISDADQAAGMVDYVYDPSLEALGEISIQKAVGYLPALARIMTADSKKVQKNVVTPSAIAAAPGNVGAIVESSVSAAEYMIDGSIIFTCIQDRIGQTLFSVVNQLSASKYPNGLARALRNQPDVKKIVEVKNLTLGKLFQGGETGLSILLDLDNPVVTDPNPNPPFTNIAVASPNEDDTNKGQIYFYYQHIRVGAGPDPNWILTWYKGAISPENLLATIPIVGEAPNVAFTIKASQAVITGDFDTGKANTDYPNLDDLSLQVTIDIKNPREGDIWTKAIANDEAGNFQAKIHRRYPFALPSGIAASAEYHQNRAVSISVT